jgi:hypothetical protein
LEPWTPSSKRRLTVSVKVSVAPACRLSIESLSC